MGKDGFDFKAAVLDQVSISDSLHEVTMAFNGQLALAALASPGCVREAYEAQKANREAVGRWIDAGYEGERPEPLPLPDEIQAVMDRYKAALKDAYMARCGSAYTMLPYTGKRLDALEPTDGVENIYMTRLVDGQFATTGSPVAEYALRAASPDHRNMRVDGREVFIPASPVREFKSDGTGVLAGPVAVYEIPVSEMSPETCLSFGTDEDGNPVGMSFARFSGEWTRDSKEPLSVLAEHVVTEMPAEYFLVRDLSCLDGRGGKADLSAMSRGAARDGKTVAAPGYGPGSGGAAAKLAALMGRDAAPGPAAVQECQERGPWGP